MEEEEKFGGDNSSTCSMEDVGYETSNTPPQQEAPKEDDSSLGAGATKQVDQLLELLALSKQERLKYTENITTILTHLEDMGKETNAMNNDTFWDSYELAYFDRSIDGGRGGVSLATTE